MTSADGCTNSWFTKMSSYFFRATLYVHTYVSMYIIDLDGFYSALQVLDAPVDFVSLLLCFG